MPSTKQKDVIEEIKEIIRDLGKAHKQAQEEMQEFRESQNKAHKQAQEEMQEIRESLKEQTKNLNKANGNFNRKWGRFMERLVKGDLINLLNDRKMEVIRVLPRVPYYRKDGTTEGEVDLIAINGKELVAVEIKTTLEIQDVNKFIKKILNPFKKHFPEYIEKTVYGAVAYLDEDEEVDVKASEYAKSEGLFVINAPGGEAKVSTITNAEDFKPEEFGKE